MTTRRRKSDDPRPTTLTGADVAAQVALTIGGTRADQITEHIDAVPWVWDGIAAAGDVVELSGKTTSGKSTLSMLLAVAMLAAEPSDLLGHRIQPMPLDRVALIVNVEQARASIRRKLREACQVLGHDEAAAMARIVVMGREDAVAFFGDDQGPTLRKIMSVKQLGLLVLDSRAKTLGGDADSEESQSWAANVLGALASDGCLVVTISHVRKSAGSEGRHLGLDDVSGSNQRAAGADVVILASARKAESGEVLSTSLVVAKRRDDGGTEHPQPMTFAIKRTSGQPATLEWGETATANTADVNEQAALFQLLATGSKTENEVSRELGWNKGKTKRELFQAVRSGKAKRCKVFRAGQRRDGYDLSADAVLAEAGILASSGRTPTSASRTFRTDANSASRDPNS